MKSPFRYAGGKQLLAPLIVDLIPRHKVYVEPFFGAGSVFFSQKSEIEVVNDLNGDLIAFYRCLQDKVKYEELQHRLNFTLYSRAEYYRADDILFGGGKHSDIDRAWAFFVCASQSFGAIVKPKLGWGVSREKKGPPSVFTGKISTLSKYHERLRNAYIDNRDAIECMKQWDTADTFFLS
jgi:DNA adenine methylase